MALPMVLNFFCADVTIRNLASLHKMLISSQAMMHSIRMFDTVLEHPKAMLLVFESRRNIPVSLGNTWPTFVDPNVDQNV